ncbi:hypothetical protein J6S55_01965 [Candidatus Saccharibacteria bacterium]|nr:hypothetical protein [Candidatus Saccharibacteria bacterium]
MDNKQPINSGQPYTAAFSQPITSPQGADMSQPMGPTQMAQPMQAQPDIQQNPVTGQPMIMQAPAPIPESKKDVKSLIKTIAIIALSLLSLTFIGLFIWMFTQYDAARTNVDGQIADAVVEAVDDNTMKLENEFAEREKYPFMTFAGPVDYGALTFEYPKTWSVYVPMNAANGGDFEAYFNPVQVDAVNNENVDSLRLAIKDVPFDSVTAQYQGSLEGETPNMRLDAVTIGQENNINANRYTGKIPGTEFNGFVVVFKIRDKTVVLQTDSVLFEGDFNTLLASIRFNA